MPPLKAVSRAGPRPRTPGFGGANVGPYGNAHADESSRGRRQRADNEARCCRHVSEHGKQDRDDDADNGDDGVLAAHIRLSTLLDRPSDFDHALVAGWPAEHLTSQDQPIDDCRCGRHDRRGKTPLNV